MDVKTLRDKYPARFEREYQEWTYDFPNYDWWDFVYESAKEDGAKLGFEIDDISFSGFWSQGDGASWTGTVRLETFIPAVLGVDTPKWFVAREAIRCDLMDASVGIYGSGGMYYHSHTMRVDGIGCEGDCEFTSGVFEGATLYEAAEQFGGTYKFVDGLGDAVLEAARGFADDIYDRLEAEYEHLTSEESFIEHCIANDVEFDDEDEDN